MTSWPDLFLLNVPCDVTGVHGRVFFRDSPSAALRHVIIRSTDTGTIYEPAHGDTRDRWEPFLKETRRLIALTRPDTAEERS